MNRVKLSSIIDIISGGTPKTDVAEYWEGGTIGWLSVTDFNNDLRYVNTTEKKITDSGLKNSNTKLLQKGDIIISARGTVGALAQIGTPMCFNQSCFGLRGKKDIADSDFLYYCLKNYVQNIKKRSQGSVFDTINLNSFDLMEIEIPKKITTQQQIASVLSSLDSKIALNNRINAKLEAMAKTIYDYWFVQFDFPVFSPLGETSEGQRGSSIDGVTPSHPVNGSIPGYKSSGGKMVWSEELKREVPEGWEVGELKDIANFTTGKLDSNAEVINAKYPFYTCSAEPTTTDTYAYDDTVILIAGNNASGNFHINRYKGKFNAYQRTYIVTAKDLIDLEYIYQVLNTETKLLKTQGKGSQTKFLTIGMLTGIKVIRNKELMKLFHEMVNPMYERQEVLKQENQQLSSLRDWLLPMLMNGQVKV